MKYFYVLALLFYLNSLQAYSTELDGNPRSWSMEDFIGFDPVGDNQGAIGDISSVFAKIDGTRLKLRVTFDNMVTRTSNMVIRDNFAIGDLQLEVKILDKIRNSEIIDYSIPANNCLDINEHYEYLRTPNNNMIEVFFNNMPRILRENLSIKIQITDSGKIIDSFQADGGGTKDGGNCAFVHHGNQGITYTEVFYGSPGGISGLDGSGFDEVLQVHEATETPGNFHMSGTLMPAAEWHNPEFNDWLASMAANGQAAMMTSALGQHIMPFTTNEMNDWSVFVESQMVNYHYNYIPRIAWVPERVWLGQGYYPDAGVIDWLGDNWTQHGVWGVVLDDGPHLNGYDNRKIHWMNNGLGIDLRVIPINNTFVGHMHYDATAAKNLIASMGQYHICVYGTDWEVAAEMNEHDGTFFLDNYENVLWYCHDNYPAINVWKLDDAISNPDFNGNNASLTKGTYGLLGGTDGYGGNNNSWYTNWASTPSHSDQHTPQWDYGTVWYDAYNFLMSVNDNNIAQLGWYTMMINLHETGWHSGGEIADWEHRYSSHIKNANVYTEASRWADGLYAVTTACYFDDIDHDGADELVMHNDKVFMVFEEIGGKANWVFYKNGFGEAFSVVSSDMAYWSETDGDYNDGSNNHVAALSDVSPNQQHSIYNISVDKPFGDTVIASLDQWGVEKKLMLYTGKDYLDVEYDFFGQEGYIKSGWSPDLLDLIWNGKGNTQRIWGDYGSYCGYRNSSSGATVAIVLGNGGADHNSEFEGTLVQGDEIKGFNKFKIRLYAGYTSEPVVSKVPELDNLAAENMDVFPPELFSPAVLVSNNEVLLNFNEALELSSSEDMANYSLQNFTNTYTIVNAERQFDWTQVKLTIAESFAAGDMGQIIVSNVTDLFNNPIGLQNTAYLMVPDGITPHSIIIDGIDDFLVGSEQLESQSHTLYITWDLDNLFLGFYTMDLNSEGDLFLNIDTDQTAGSGATNGSWGRVTFADPYLPEFQVAIEGGGGSMQVNNWTGTNWNYPGNGAIGNSYEGWSNNGFTEISVPGYALGNPDGMAISVHVSEEDSQHILEIFPGINATGNHPEIEYFYAFYEPYITGPMPLSGMEPNSVFTLPNTGPQITDFSPLELNQTLLTNSNMVFEITAEDADNDEITYIWQMDGITVGNDANFEYNPGSPDIGNHTLLVVVSDDVPGNSTDELTWDIEVMESSLVLNLTVLLEGPFENTTMNTGLNAGNCIPLVQPYNTTPWNYPGNEEVLSIPGNDIVDWILVEIRDATNANSAGASSVIARRAAFVKNNGTVIGIDGEENLVFNETLIENMFVVIRHRNHIDIMSANPLVITDGLYSYNFSDAASKIHGGENACKQISGNIWGMTSGDGNADNMIDYSDKISAWFNYAGKSGYLLNDFNLDGQSNNPDKDDLWLPNIGVVSAVPE
jgi:hypothetical protein